MADDEPKKSTGVLVWIIYILLAFAVVSGVDSVVFQTEQSSTKYESYEAKYKNRGQFYG